MRGCDVWVNLPRPPLEASGTSGMKSAVNGGLQLSVLDGWWAEAYDGANGWALSARSTTTTAPRTPATPPSSTACSRRRSAAFYDRDAGIPRRWLALVRASLRTIGPRFSAGRMLADYEERSTPSH